MRDVYKMKISYFLFAALLLGCGNKKNAGSQTALSLSAEIERDTVASVVNDGYEQFKAYFPDLKLGKDGLNDKFLLPENDITKILFDQSFTEEEVQGGAYEKVYGIAKKLDYNGYDLYIYHHDYYTPEMDEYEGRCYGNNVMVLFKNGNPVMKDGGLYQIPLSANCAGEGGTSTSNTYFNEDMVMIRTDSVAESESATGFGTPICSKTETHVKLNVDGELDTLGVMRAEFSSPFFDTEYLHKEDSIYMAIEESKRYRLWYPENNDGWHLILSCFTYETFNWFNPNVDLYFYVERANGKLIAVFVSRENDGRLLDTYRVGERRQNNPPSPDYSKRNKVLKCPIIMKTSDGDIELMPDGKFRNI